MSISLLVPEFWRQFSFIMDRPEFRKSKTAQSEICPISGDWDKLGIPNLERMSVLKI